MVTALGMNKMVEVDLSSLIEKMNEGKDRGLNLDWKTLLIIGIAACGIIVYVVTSVITGNQAVRDIAQLRIDTNNGLTEIKKAIETLPDQRASITSLQQKAVDDARWRSVMEDRIGTLTTSQATLSADVESIKRASNVPLRK